MIARLRGRCVANTPDGLVLDVGGVGYLVAATPTAVRAATDSDEVSVHTYLHVREDALQLYGFAEPSERELFVQLLSVNGIGPKVALAIVSGSPAAELRRAIALEDTARFQAIPGIGKKTAERIVLELKEKLGAGVPEAAAPAASGAPTHLVARDALVELGWTVVEAEQALAETDPDLTPEERVRQALKKAA
jgi:Holliday junction DNA helicase RuvA